MLAIGDGIERFAREQIERTTDLQTVLVKPKMFDRVDGMPLPRTGYPIFTLADADALGAHLDTVAGVAATLQGNARLTFEGGKPDGTAPMMLIFKLAMGVFAAISLLVGGIGIMNVLLASVIERTREIGIRKAAGARHRDILVQFLGESVAISSVGAVAGAALGPAGAFGITALIRARSGAKLFAAFTWNTLAVAMVVTIAVGLIFGTYPALRAARLSPIDAIRHE